MPDEDALLSALTTEHFVLQSARGVITSEGAARATLYVGAVSSALVALAFTSDLGSEAYAWFLAAVLPALVVLGEFTFVRLVEVSVEDLRYLRQIQRIRQYYATLSAEAGRFFPNADDASHASLFRFMGLRDRRMQTLFTARHRRTHSAHQRGDADAGDDGVDGGHRRGRGGRRGDRGGDGVRSAARALGASELRERPGRRMIAAAAPVASIDGRRRGLCRGATS